MDAKQIEKRGLIKIKFFLKKDKLFLISIIVEYRKNSKA